MQLDRIRQRVRKGHAAEETKKRLMQAGVELFGHYSFGGVSTRNLADRANVNLAAIQYYFGGKEGLYLAVARHIVARVSSWSSPQILKTERILVNENPDKETCYKLLCELLDRLLAHGLREPESKKWVGIFMREQIEPTEAFDILYKGIMEPIHNCLCKLIGRMLDLAEDDDETRIRSYAVSGPILIFHLSRGEIGRTLDWDAFDTDEIDAIRRVVFEHSRAIFGMPKSVLKEYFASRPSIMP
jgi:TetR/AcrR family transcriptional regulator, regulator of cefoperazone and chloramphenicol sensitivity